MSVTGSNKFAIIGLAGYIASRHLAAMKNVGGSLLYSHDLSDSVGIVDRYFPDAGFTVNPSCFRKELEKGAVDYLSVCTPNYLHTPHSISGLECGVDVICEKPLATSMKDLELMEMAELRTGRQIHPILQLRLHPEIISLRHFMENRATDTLPDIDLTYVTPRGAWYMESWKGDPQRSGGLIANIGIHFIDMLGWIFGNTSHITIHHSSPDCISGLLLLKKGRVRFFLSINKAHMPHSTEGDTWKACRCMTVDGNPFDFSDISGELHSLSYARILEGKGFSTRDARLSVEIIEKIRSAVPQGVKGDCHPMLLNI